MPRPQSACAALPLPKSWPRRVRSAVIRTISLAQISLTHARSVAANSVNARIRLKQDNDRLRQEILLLREESRIKDMRMEQIPAQRRPHYPPVERLAILELRAARGWSLAQTAKRFLITPVTVASWMTRLDEEGSATLVRVPQPVNKFPDFVGYLVCRLKVLCPTMGKARIANVLCRAGLHLGATTVRTMLREADRPEPTKRRTEPAMTASERVVTAREPNHVWHCDLTTVPTALGFWIPWLPQALPQRWPFCWWLAVVIDHYSRRVMGVAVFLQQPSSKAVQAFLDRAIRVAGKAPDHLITDQGKQFVAKSLKRWCRRRGICQRFGAIGKYGSIAVIERLMPLSSRSSRGVSSRFPSGKKLSRKSSRSGSRGTTRIDPTRGSARVLQTRSTSAAVLRVVLRVLNLDPAGPADQGVRVLMRSSEGVPACESISRSPTFPAASISRSSRCAAPPEILNERGCRVLVQ